MAVFIEMISMGVCLTPGCVAERLGERVWERWSGGVGEAWGGRENMKLISELEWKIKTSSGSLCAVLTISCETMQPP